MSRYHSMPKRLGLFVPFSSDAGPFVRRCKCKYTLSLQSLPSARRLCLATRPAQAPSDPFPSEDEAKHSEWRRRERPAWQVQKAALREKLGQQSWNPRKKLSPDAMEGIRHLHASQPDRFTTPILSEHFKVSPEAIRRILKSNWRPTDEEMEDRRERWQKRGEKIWSSLVELGVKPPKPWREMGVGRAKPGERPRWKSGNRNLVHIGDSVDTGIQEHMLRENVIPTVNEKKTLEPSPKISFLRRL